MLLRLWMILALAFYPALAGWMPVGECPKARVAGAQAAQGCCQLPPAERKCCRTHHAGPAAAAAAQPAGCCASALPDPVPQAIGAAPTDECCPFRGYCRGPCPHLPHNPLGPPTQREPTPNPDKPMAGVPSRPLLAVEPGPARPTSWTRPPAMAVSQRLAMICLRTT